MALPRGDRVGCRAEAHVQEHERGTPFLQPRRQARRDDVDRLGLDARARAWVHDFAACALADGQKPVGKHDDLAAVVRRRL